MFDFEARVYIGWLANTLSQLERMPPTETQSKKLLVFLLRWPGFLAASVVIAVTAICNM